MSTTDYVYAFKKIRTVFVGIFLFGIFGAVGWYSLETLPHSTTEVSAVPVSVTSKASPNETGVALPVRLIIPAIQLSAAVQSLGLDANGTGDMAVPTNFTDVGWYELGTRPGMSGSAVIAGHYNGKNTREAVFYDLNTLQIGDEVLIVTEASTTQVFIVVRIETYAYDAYAGEVFFSTDGKQRLNLITCGGVWMPENKLYDKRTVVFTELRT